MPFVPSRFDLTHMTRLSPSGTSRISRILRGLRLSRALPLMVLLGVLSACAHQQPAPNRIERYDLGPFTQAGSNSASRTMANGAGGSVPPLLKVLDVSVAAALDNDQIHYRLDYADPYRFYSYARSRWSVTPAQLLTQRLRRSLSGSMRVLDAGDAESAPLLKVEVLDFTQRFSAAGKGNGVVVVRASLRGPASTGGHLLAQHEFSASVPGAESNAEGAAASIATATDQVLAQIRTWLDQEAPLLSLPK